MKEFSSTSGHALPDGDAAAIESDDNAMRAMDLKDIAPSLTNPRKNFDPVRLQELADSIKASGVHQPILVRPLPGSRVEETSLAKHRGQKWQGYRVPTYELVAGERRLRASQLAGTTTIPVLIRTLTDEQVLEIQIVENLQRDDLTHLEEAEGYEQLMRHASINADDVGAKIGKSRSYVYARLKLLDLSQECKQALRTSQIDASRALLIARIPDSKLQIKALEQLVKKDYDGEPYMGYRRAAAWVQQEFMLRLDTARFKITDADLLPEAGSCRTCTKRTGANPDLFADVKGADVCTDPPCFHRKEDAHTAALMKSAHEQGQTVIDGREAKALMPNGWGSIEGYLRLDDARDSPTDKTLRKMLGKQLPDDDVKVTLIANPHKNGELIAVLPTATVAELLKTKGHCDAADVVQKELHANKREQAAGAKEKLKQDYEHGWRAALLQRTWSIVAASDSTVEECLSTGMLRYIAAYFAGLANADTARHLCKLLDLGKVAPKDALMNYVHTCARPDKAVMLMLMQRDTAYRPWLPDDHRANESLLLVADEFGIDVDVVKTEIKAQIKAVVAPKIAPKPLLSNASLAQPEQAAGKNPKTEGKTTRGPVRKAKLSAEDATSGIATAMQGLEQAATARPEIQNSLAVGRRVRVSADTDRLGQILSKWAAKEGTVTHRSDDGTFLDVTFKGRNGGIAMFSEDLLETVVVAA